MYQLIPMERQHLDQVLGWRNDPRVRENMYTSHVISAEEHYGWYEAANSDRSRRLLLCVDSSGLAVGVVIFSAIDTFSQSATWAFYSGDTARRGVGTEMEKLALDYAFLDLGLYKLNCEVLSFNLAVVEFHRKFGFRIEGIFRNHYRRNGAWHDVFRLAHFKDIWLNDVKPELSKKSALRVRIGATVRNEVSCADEQAVIFEVLRLSSEFPVAGASIVGHSVRFVATVRGQMKLEIQLRLISRFRSCAVIAFEARGPNGTVAAGDVDIAFTEASGEE